MNLVSPLLFIIFQRCFLRRLYNGLDFKDWLGTIIQMTSRDSINLFVFLFFYFFALCIIMETGLHVLLVCKKNIDKMKTSSHSFREICPREHLYSSSTLMLQNTLVNVNFNWALLGFFVLHLVHLLRISTEADQSENRGRSIPDQPLSVISSEQSSSPH